MAFQCPPLPCQLHATCVSLLGNGLLLVGRAGIGKSTLALELMALGAELVADDRCDISVRGEYVAVRRPPNLPQAIEARGIGLLSAPCVDEARLVGVVDLEGASQERLPVRRYVDFAGTPLPLIQKSDQTNLAAALLHFLKFGFHGSINT